MNVLRLGLLAFKLISTTFVVACGAEESKGAAPSGLTDSGAGGAGSGGTTTTGGAAATSSGGAATASPDSGACLPDLSRCDDGAPCCAGSVCSEGSTGERRCRRTCTERTDCGSLCCLEDTASGQKLCTDASLCPAIECSAQGGSCTGAGEACCSGLVCVAWKNPPRSGCEKACGAPGDCASGCCLPLANSNTSFCAAAEACQCAPLDATCGGSARCCSGLECTSFDATGAFACKPTCHEDRDCASGCCAPLTGTSASVCLGKEWCGK
jgi:hypothetical protein